MSWYKIAKSGLSKEKLNERLKEIIRKEPFFHKLYKEYGIPMEQIDENLVFVARDLEDIYAQGNGKYIFINSKLFEKGDFFQNGIHYVVHEITHWLTRQKEKEHYFQDPEESAAFQAGITYELLRGKNKKEITETFYPIIKPHFEDENNAKKFFEALFIKAVKKAKDYQK